MRRDAHVRCGGRAGETHPPRGGQGAPVRPDTKLRGPTRGVFFDLYAIMDIYSRRMMHWQVHATETGELAKSFLEQAVEHNAGVMPTHIHSDNGTSMTSKTVADLLVDLHITRSLSRPKVSNDNPYSEAAFKTLKYCPAFPENFTTLGEAARFADAFFDY